jgi:hemerythrin-like domain-containing protein
MSELSEPKSIIETRLAHGVHRRATSLLAEAAARPAADSAALAELREFLVATLHHHHESEDADLWPLITAIAPETAGPLAELSTEHDELDATLDALAAAPLDDRAALEKASVAVRDLVHLHLEHEEPLLLPALRDHVSEEAWEEFSNKVIATSPPAGAHLMVALFDEVGTPDEVELMLSSLPAPVQALVPMMRVQAKATLDALQTTG